MCKNVINNYRVFYLNVDNVKFISIFYKNRNNGR